MHARFRFAVASALEHEDLVGTLYFDDVPACVLRQARTSAAMELEIPSAPGGGKWHFSLVDFEEALGALKKRMWQLRGVDDEVPTRIASNEQLHEAVKEIIESLRQAGEADLAADLRGALYISNVSGEVLGETREQLRRVRAALTPDTARLRGAIDEAIRAIDDAFERSRGFSRTPREDL